jgi:hypothetical protein
MPLLLNVALEYAVRNVQENQVGLKLYELHQLLVYADDRKTLLGNKKDTIKRNTENLIDVSMEVGLIESGEKTKYTLISPERRAKPYLEDT